MPLEENKALILRYFAEVHNQGNLAILAELQEPEYAAQTRQFIPLWRRAFPDLQVTVNELVAEGNRVVADLTFQGTHQGVLEGQLLPAWFPQSLPPTGKRVAYRGIYFFTIAAGKMQSEGHSGIADWMALLGQLGFAPAPDLVGR
jgi:predicted ester cyclase